MLFTSIEITQLFKMKCRRICGQNSIRWIAMAFSFIFVITVFSTLTPSKNLIESECNLCNYILFFLHFLIQIQIEILVLQLLAITRIKCQVLFASARSHIT
jgi:hypothetical protein